MYVGIMEVLKVLCLKWLPIMNSVLEEQPNSAMGLAGRMAREGEMSMLVAENPLINDTSLSWPPSGEKFTGWFSVVLMVVGMNKSIRWRF